MSDDGLALLDLAEAEAYSRGGDCGGARQSALRKELLDLARVGLILQTMVAPANDPVQDHCVRAILGRRP